MIYSKVNLKIDDESNETKNTLLTKQKQLKIAPSRMLHHNLKGLNHLWLKTLLKQKCNVQILRVRCFFFQRVWS